MGKFRNRPIMRKMQNWELRVLDKCKDDVELYNDDWGYVLKSYFKTCAILLLEGIVLLIEFIKDLIFGCVRFALQILDGLLNELRTVWFVKKE